MKPTNRRSFLKAATLPFVVGFGILPLSEGLQAETLNTPIASKSKIKLSLNAWSYYVPLYKHMKGESGGHKKYLSFWEN